MASELTTVEEPSLPAPVARRGLNEAQWRTLKNSVFPGAANDSILMAVDYCKARGLDVLKKPCHIVPMNVKDAKTDTYSWRDVILPGIYEYRITAARTGEYVGCDAPQFGPPIEYMGVKAPESCTITVYRKVAGERIAFSATVFFEEACVVRKGKNGGAPSINEMWTRRPRGQLAKCAEAQALRMAFPEELGGEPTADEVNGGTVITGESRVVATTVRPIEPEQIAVIPDDVRVAMDEAATLGTPALSAVFGGLSAETRALITKHYSSWWEGLKSQAAEVQP